MKMPDPKIRYLSDSQIDKQKWDACINNSINGLVYAYSWYLDSCTDRWDALVLGNYEAVMPIPLVRRRGKWKIHSMLISAQLGIFANKIPDETTVLSFLNELSKRYKRWSLPFNLLNPEHISGYESLLKTKFSKDLIYPSDVHQRMAGSDNIDSKGDAMSVSKGAQLAVILNFVLRIYGSKIASSEILALRRIISFSMRFGFGTAYSVYSSTNNIIGLSYLIRFRNRLYMLFCISDMQADKQKVYQKILNRIYSDFENQDYVLECIARDDEALEHLLKKNGFSGTTYAVLRKHRRLFGWMRNNREPEKGLSR